MSLAERISHEHRASIEKRTIGGLPFAPWTHPLWRFNIGGPPKPSKEVQGQDSVLGLAAVYSATRYIADMVASLPVKVYRELPSGQVERVRTTMLLGSPTSGGGPQIEGTFYDWLFQGTISALLHGNAWGFVTNRSGIPGADGLGLPSTVAWLPPDKVSVTDSTHRPEDTRTAKVFYLGGEVERSDLVQLRAYPVAGQLEGISPIRRFATLWSQGLHALGFSSTWFENGGFPPGVFQNVGEEVNDQQAKQIRQRLTDTIRLQQPLVIGKDWDYKAISVPPDEAAFIGAAKLNATQVAAIFGVPPWRVGGDKGSSLTYSNQSSDQVDVLVNTLRPWLTRWEHLLTSMLPASQYAVFDVSPLLKMDPKTEVEVEQIQRDTGLETQNEIRRGHDLPPVPGGDDSLPLNVLARMMSGSRVIPKAFLPLLQPESELTAGILQGLQDSGFGSAKPPPGVSAESYLEAQVMAGRAAEVKLAELRSKETLRDLSGEDDGPDYGVGGVPGD